MWHDRIPQAEVQLFRSVALPQSAFGGRQQHFVESAAAPLWLVTRGARNLSHMASPTCKTQDFPKEINQTENTELYGNILALLCFQQQHYWDQSHNSFQQYIYKSHFLIFCLTAPQAATGTGTLLQTGCIYMSKVHSKMLNMQKKKKKNTRRLWAKAESACKGCTQEKQV